MNRRIFSLHVLITAVFVTTFLVALWQPQALGRYAASRVRPISKADAHWHIQFIQSEALIKKQEHELRECRDAMAEQERQIRMLIQGQNALRSRLRNKIGKS